MNIHELDSYNLGDAVKFNDKLNPRIWGADEKMRPEVREQLLKIADDFREFLGIDVELKDITVSGSNAAFTYTPHSDIDLHLVVDLPEADRNAVYRELFDAKKYAYNEQHDIRIGGSDVELYVQDANKKHHSQGIYSIVNDDWISVPKRRRPDVDDISVKSKFEDLGHRIETAIKSQDYEKISAMAEKIRDYRQAGLDAHGEFGPENLAFKILRTQGLIKKLYDARNAAKDELLSLDERKKKKKKKTRYGFGGYWYPGTAYAGQDHPAGTEGGDGGGDGGGESMREDAGMTWDGVNPTTDMFTSEDATMTWDGVNPSTAMFTTETEDKTDEEILRDFVDFCVKELKIKQMPAIKLRRDPQWPAVHRTFGRYNDDAKTLEVAWGQRHIMDVLRTVAHELTHKHQHEREGQRMGPDAGETGSPYENEANARAGVLMRDYGRLHPEYFSVGQATDLNEEEKVYGIAGFKVLVKDGYFYIYKGPDLIYRSVAPRTYTRDQLIKQVERAITMTGATVKQSGTRAKPKYGIEDAYKRLLQIITYRVDRGIDIDPETIRKEIATIVNDYKVTEKDLRKKWAQTKPYKYSKTPELFAPYSRFYKYFSSNSNTPWSELYQVRRNDKYYQWLDQQMKNWMQKHGLAVTESASGYIPTKAQANDPRYSMALTVDIKPGQVGKEANKLKLKTDRQGHPQIARANGLFENLYREYKQFKAAEDYSPDNPPGPEFKPTMPAGTLRVDVSDVYDWYKLGQHISNMKGLGRHDFGAGPPSSIISFGDEDTEHKFIGDIAATGLDVTDIDPASAKKPAGKKIKTDPTYNVDEVIQTPVSKEQRAEQEYLRFIMAKVNSGRVLNRHEQQYLKDYQAKKKLAELAPSPGYGGDDEDDVPRYLMQLANLWWNQADPEAQQEVTRELAAGGWTIRQIDDDTVLLNHKEYGITYRISDDQFDPDLYEAEQNFAIASQPIPGDKFRLTINNRPFVLTPGGFGKQHSQVFLDSFYLTDMKSGKTEFVDSWWNWPLAKAIADHLDQNHADALVRIGKADFAWHEKNDDWDSQPPRLQGIRRQTSVGIPAKDFVKSVDAVKRVTGNVDETNDKLSQYLKTKLDAQSKQFAFQGYRVVYEPTQVNVYKGADLVYTKKGDYSQPNKANLQSARSMIGTLVRTQQRKDAVNLDLKDQQPVNEDEDLDEVKMSPGALEKFATSDAAKGIRAGFEAELIFRDTQGESEELDPEPNYDADERCYSIQQVIDFFSNDEYGFGLSDRQQNRLMDDLDEKYMEWRDEQIISDFRNDAEDLIRDILLAETPMDQRIHFYLTDSLQMSDEEADAVIKAGADAPKFTNSEAQKDYADENPEYKAYLEAADEAEQELEESVEFSVNRQDEYWDEALDKYRDDYSGDDDSFFSDVGLRWMSDVANEYNLDWPVWDGGGQQNYGNRNWETIGALLQDAVDMPVVVSSNYHTTRRRPGQWIIEPDGSLDPDDKSEEAGLEIVSPPMPLLTAIEKLRVVTDWANNPKTGNAYTNSSTGLHMGVSLPTMKSEGQDDDIGIDYVKLILFLGDKYVQQQFGREANTYCASALDKLKQNIKGKRSDPAGVVELLRHGLTELAQRELQKGVGTSKYTSAHIQPGYIEFRSPGGDWLAKADEEIGVLENTMMRFARAMAIAGDPNAERQEYAKKLYKLVTADNPEYADQLKLFSEFSAGTINKEQLKKQWADTVLQKELPSVGKEEYEVYRQDNKDSPDATVATFYAKDYDDAYDQFLRQYGRDINNLDVRIKQPWFDVFDDSGKIVKTIRARDIDTATDRAQYEFGERWTDAWKIYRRPDDTPEPKASPRAQVAKRIVTKPKPEPGDADASDWEAVYKPTGRVFDTLAHADTEQALAWRDMVMRSHGFTNVSDILVRRAGHQQAADARRDSADLQRNLGVQDVETDVAQNFEPRRMNYELVSDEDPDRVIHRMPNATADEVRAWIAQQEQGGMPAGFLRTRIVAEAIDPVSGSGVIPPRQDPKNTSKKTVQPAEKVFKQPVKSGLYKSAIGQAISQRDLENMTHQIQVARKLGDSVMEMEDTPPEVMRALDQAAQKNGYRNWADVKANPRSDRAVITVAKLANEIMKTSGPHHEKIFYKSKTDENFADKKVSGKSRPGRVKRAGASCAGSVTDLRARAKKYGGEKGRMYHWCANMKSGRKK